MVINQVSIEVFYGALPFLLVFSVRYWIIHEGTFNFSFAVLQLLIHSLVEMFLMEQLKKCFNNKRYNQYFFIAALINMSFKLSVVGKFPSPWSIMSCKNKACNYFGLTH